MILRASDEVVFEGATIEEIKALVKVFKEDVYPLLWGEPEPEPESEPDAPADRNRLAARTAPPPAPQDQSQTRAESPKAEEVRLAAEYMAATGKSFYYMPHGKDKGKLRVEALREWKKSSKA